MTQRSGIMTIERYILAQQRNHPQATGAFSDLMRDIALAAKIIARETTRAGLVNIIGNVGTTNISGESQKKIDIFADDTIARICGSTGRLCIMASEEHDDVIEIPADYPAGRYVLIFDPLDGSANIDANNGLGTIFAIYRKVSTSERGSLEDVLQPGLNLVAAGYIVYGPSTMFVYSTGQGVHAFTLDPSVGEFLLSYENLQVTEPPRYFCVNVGKAHLWSAGVTHYVRWLQGLEGDHVPLDARYSGCFAMDFHRVLFGGGVYLYPMDADKPSGKLRLTYEANAMAFLATQAGGYASDGVGDILKLQPKSLHQRVPLFIGNRSLVEQAERLIAEHDQDWVTAYRGGKL